MNSSGVSDALDVLDIGHVPSFESEKVTNVQLETDPGRPPLVAAIAANNEAVDLMQSGYVDSSREIFMNVAEILFAVSKALKQGEPCPGLEDGRIKMAFGKISATIQTARSTKPSSTGQRNEATCFLIEHGIYLPAFSKQSINSFCSVESTTVLFNMALSSHLTNERPTRSSLRSVISMYDMALSVAKRIEFKDRTASRVVTSCLNNLGQVFHEIGEFSCSRVYLAELAAFILSPDSEWDDFTFSDNERMFILLNVLVLQNHTAAPAA